MSFKERKWSLYVLLKNISPFPQIPIRELTARKICVRELTARKICGPIFVYSLTSAQNFVPELLGILYFKFFYEY